MRLYDSAPSGNCYKVRLLLTQLGIAFERQEVDTRRRDGRDDLLGGKNPALRVPVLELDDGRHLAESNAILWYLAEGTQYVSDDPYERAKTLQWMFFEQYDHEPNVAVVRHRTMLGHLDDYPDSEQRRDRGYAALTAMEQQLDEVRLLRRRPVLDRGHRALRVHARGTRRRDRPGRVPGDQRLARPRGEPAGPHHDRRLGPCLRPSASPSFALLVAHQRYATRARTSRPAT